MSYKLTQWIQCVLSLANATANRHFYLLIKLMQCSFHSWYEFTYNDTIRFTSVPRIIVCWAPLFAHWIDLIFHCETVKAGRQRKTTTNVLSWRRRQRQRRKQIMNYLPFDRRKQWWLEKARERDGGARMRNKKNKTKNNGNSIIVLSSTIETIESTEPQQ